MTAVITERERTDSLMGFRHFEAIFRATTLKFSVPTTKVCYNLMFHIIILPSGTFIGGEKATPRERHVNARRFKGFRPFQAIFWGTDLRFSVPKVKK
jgi:hypothetical protein